MGFAKRPRDVVKGLKVSELRELLRNQGVSIPSGYVRRSHLLVLVNRVLRPRIIRNNYGGLKVTPRQARRIRKARNRVDGMKKV